MYEFVLPLVVLCFLVGSPFALTSHSRSNPDESFDYWLQNVRARALNKGVSSTVIEDRLSGLTLDKRVVKNSENQAEFTTPYPEYRGYFLTDGMIHKARRLKRHHREVLRTLENRYGVPAEVLLAIWGIESRYGEKESQYEAVSSLASMAYGNPSRREYFTDELITLLSMIDSNRIKKSVLRSSWAGALGQPQFMPSSYKNYAADYDGTGSADIWDDPADVLASIANYLHANGWDSSATWGSKLADGADQGNPSVFSPKGTSDRYRRSENFSVLMSYNSSRFYALTVGLLSDEIGGLETLEE